MDEQSNHSMPKDFQEFDQSGIDQNTSKGQKWNIGSQSEESSDEFISSVNKNCMGDHNQFIQEGNNPIKCDICNETFTCTFHEGKESNIA